MQGYVSTRLHLSTIHTCTWIHFIQIRNVAGTATFCGWKITTTWIWFARILDQRNLRGRNMFGRRSATNWRKRNTKNTGEEHECRRFIPLGNIFRFLRKSRFKSHGILSISPIVTFGTKEPREVFIATIFQHCIYPNIILFCSEQHEESIDANKIVGFH